MSTHSMSLMGLTCKCGNQVFLPSTDTGFPFKKSVKNNSQIFFQTSNENVNWMSID